MMLNQPIFKIITLLSFPGLNQNDATDASSGQFVICSALGNFYALILFCSVYKHQNSFTPTRSFIETSRVTTFCWEWTALLNLVRQTTQGALHGISPNKKTPTLIPLLICYSHETFCAGLTTRVDLVIACTVKMAFDWRKILISDNKQVLLADKTNRARASFLAHHFTGTFVVHCVLMRNSTQNQCRQKTKFQNTMQLY